MPQPSGCVDSIQKSLKEFLRGAVSEFLPWASIQLVSSGDDIPDIEAMRHVGLAVAPADAAPEVKQVAAYISPIAGGYGVGREILEQVMKAQGLWMSDKKAFGW